MRHLFLIGLCIFLVLGCGETSPKPKSPASSEVSMGANNKAPTSDLDYEGKAGFKRQRSKLAKEYKVALKRFNVEKAKIAQDKDSRIAALAKQSSEFEKSNKQLMPLELRVAKLSKQKESKTNTLNELEAELTKKREELQLQEQKVAKEKKEYLAFVSGIDAEISTAKAKIESFKVSNASKGVSIAKEKSKIISEAKAAEEAIEQKAQLAKAVYTKSIAALDLKEKAAIEDAEKKAIAEVNARKEAQAKAAAELAAKRKAEAEARAKAKAEARANAVAAKKAKIEAAKKARAEVAAKKKAAAEAKAAAVAMAKAKAVADAKKAAASKAMENDTDRPGGDYRIMVLDSAKPQLCRSACKSDSQCKAWTYVKPNILGDKARCFLKNAVTQKESSVCCISGVNK